MRRILGYVGEKRAISELAVSNNSKSAIYTLTEKQLNLRGHNWTLH